jgi:hypothetical protein
MRIESAMLADAATVREGLLHVMGGGITRIRMQELPGPLPLTFAFRVVLETREFRPSHQLVLRLLTREGREEASVETIFQVVPDAPVPVEEAGIAAPIPLSSFVVPRRGKYLIEATLNKYTFATLPLSVSLITDPGEA